MRRGVAETHLYVVAYDIPDDRRRTRVHKLLSGFGQWTQYSLFECHLTAKEVLLLRSRLARLLAAEDHVRIYFLCDGCLGRVDAIGGARPEAPSIYVV